MNTSNETGRQTFPTTTKIPRNYTRLVLRTRFICGKPTPQIIVTPLVYVIISQQFGDIIIPHEVSSVNSLYVTNRPVVSYEQPWVAADTR